MNTKNLLCIASALVLITGASAQAQSLPEVAKAEKARRAKIRAQGGGPAKLYTEGDRSAATSADPAQPTASPTDAAAPAGVAGASTKKKEKTPEELAAERQKEWNDKLKAAQDEIKQLQDEIDRNERNLAAMINITPARADLANRIDSDKKKMVTLRQKLVDLEEERRRAGMPRPR